MQGKAYLDYPKFQIRDFLGNSPIEALFVPYAAVTFSFDEYEQKVNERFTEIGHSVKGIHHFDDPVKAVQKARAIVVGGGNTWHLVYHLQKRNLMNAIREKVLSGTPYIGWSAGSNIACPTLKTTNDMPIIDPVSFETTGLVPFQINPHYLDENPEGHAGETRQQRIEEFIEINPGIYVVGLREGSMLKLENEKLRLIGKNSVRIFKKGQIPKEVNAGEDLSFLINSQ